MKKYFFFISLAFFFCSCGTNVVRLTVTEPAPVSIPGYIKKVGIINRSLLVDENRFINKVDQILSEKGPELDKEGSQESIRGVKDALTQNGRFTAIAFLDKVNLRVSTPGNFPSPLSWDVIEGICRDNSVDAIFALELFDTDSKISYSSSPTTIKTPLGNIPGVEHHATMVTLIKIGWRIYDPKNKGIIDEFPMSKSLTFTGNGINPIEAAKALIDRKEAVRQSGYEAGTAYAQRILPFNLRVSREFYVKGTGNFNIAKRMARIGNWDDAARLWKQETENSNLKIKSRAYYNMAISSEINGDLDAALDWAKKSYVIGNKRLAADYVNILKYRIRNNTRLQRQEEDAK